jgi:hypothetical protein
LTTPLAVTEGQELAVVVSNTTGNYRIDNILNLAVAGYPYAASKLSAVDTKVLASAVVALNYGGTYYPVLGVLHGVTSSTLGANTTPDEIGNLFVPTLTVRVTGIQVLADFDGPCDIIIYSGATTLATVSVDPDVRAATAAGGLRLKLTAPITLYANNPYRLSVKPTSATTILMFYFSSPSAAARAASGGGISYQYTSRVDAGAWTETDTRQAGIYAVVDGFDVERRVHANEHHRDCQ